MAGYDAGGTLTCIGGAGIMALSALDKVPMLAGHVPPGAFGVGAGVFVWGLANVISSTKK
jgi:hypothetical protein